jgi:hypothetical protein
MALSSDGRWCCRAAGLGAIQVEIVKGSVIVSGWGSVFVGVEGATRSETWWYSVREQVLFTAVLSPRSHPGAFLFFSSSSCPV